MGYNRETTIMKKTIYFAFLLVTAMLFGCSKDMSDLAGGDGGSGGGGGGGGGLTKNNVTLGTDTYKILSAGYAVDGDNLYILFETENPNVFLYFSDRNSIPEGEMDISYEASWNNCLVTYYFDSQDYLSNNGNLKITLSNGNYTVEADGHMSSSSGGDKTFTIYYKGEINYIPQGGSGGGSGGGSQNSFSIGPAFSYYHYYGGEGHINVYCDNDNMEWTASSDSYWCELSSTGGVGDGRVNFYVYENYTTVNVDRTARITFRSKDGQTVHHAYIMQHPYAYELEVSVNHLEFSAYGGERYIYVYVNNGYEPLSWTATCDASWVQLSQYSGEWETGIYVTVGQSNTQRSTEIKFTSQNGTVRYVTINQKAPEDVKITVSQAEYTYYVDSGMAFEVKYLIENNSKSYTLYYINFTIKHAGGAVTTHTLGSTTNTSSWNLGPGSSTWTGTYDCWLQYQSGQFTCTINDALFY